MKRRKKAKKEEKYIFSFNDTMNLTLHFIGLIIIIYGAWFHNVLWVTFGFIPMLIGDWWFKVHRKI
ncbi:hypothetical protein HN865_05320 [Candidatus Woesearchaeota archaeon]|jgi:hypothetical protein|nr:hypothetical protein [Candidatus Woesearchaeota archaeon]MBT7238237.1 hypothetical protein [Candidatus Woesearchaeota archaeon]